MLALAAPAPEDLLQVHVSFDRFAASASESGLVTPGTAGGDRPTAAQEAQNLQGAMQMWSRGGPAVDENSP